MASLLCLLLAAACQGGGSSPTPTPDGTTVPTLGLTSEVVVANAQFPVTLAFAPDGRLFYNELQAGNIRVVLPDGTLLPEPLAHVDVAQGTEWGLIGLALDPDFEANHYIYIYFMQPVREVEADEGIQVEQVAKPVVMRFTEVDNRGLNPTVLLRDLPETDPTREPIHVGGNLHFGPDGYLYISIGEYDLREVAQDLTTVRGKILRVRKQDGSAAPDNPFIDTPGADPRIFAYGLRNPFDFTFHPQTGQVYATENGPSTCDELNLVAAGQNYGWPGSEFPASCQDLPGVPPIYSFAAPGMPPEAPGSTVGPTGIEFVSREVYPALGDSLLACEYNTGFMRRLILAGENQDQVASDDVVVSDCRLDIVSDPNGIIYYSNPEQILRLVPQ